MTMCDLVWHPYNIDYILCKVPAANQYWYIYLVAIHIQQCASFMRWSELSRCANSFMLLYVNAYSQNSSAGDLTSAVTFVGTSSVTFGKAVVTGWGASVCAIVEFNSREMVALLSSTSFAECLKQRSVFQSCWQWAQGTSRVRDLPK